MIRSSHRTNNGARNVALLTWHARRLLQFSVVGTIGVGVNMALFALLTRHYFINPIVAVVLATEGAIVCNFALNDRWTFRLHRGDAVWLRRAFAYNVVCAGGLGISMSVFAICSLMVRGPDLLTNLIAIGAGTLWNYVANVRLTWRSGCSISSCSSRQLNTAAPIQEWSIRMVKLLVGVTNRQRLRQASAAWSKRLPFAARSGEVVAEDSGYGGRGSARMPASPKEISNC